MTGEGAIAIYREATGLGTLNSTTPVNMSYDTVVLESDTDTIEKNGSTPYSSFQLKRAGYYLVIYNTAGETQAGSNRTELITKITVAAGTIKYGMAQGYDRRSEGCDETYNHGLTIVKITSSSALTITYQRTDNNSSATMRERAGKSSLSIVYLGETQEACRLYMSTNVQTTTGSWTSVTWDQQDEVDTNAFAHSAVSNSENITLKREGRLYLFLVNTGWINTTTSRSQVHVRATLAGRALEHGYGGTYVRGTVNSCQNGVAVQAFLVDNDTANQVLKIEVLDEGSSCGVDVTNSGLTAICLPASAKAIMLHDSTGGTSCDTSGTAIPFDTEDREDPPFDHSTPTDDVVLKTDGGNYLFMAAIRNTRTSGINRYGTLIEWRDGTTAYTRGSFGMYNRGDTTLKAACAGGIILPSVTLNDVVDLYMQDESSSSGTAPALEADCSSLCGLLIDSLFITETVGRLVDGGLINAGNVGGRLCA